MEGLKSNLAARVLAIAGLFLLGLGGLVYALATFKYFWGLVLAGAGLVLLVVAAVVNRRSLARMATHRQTRLGLGSLVGVLAFLALVIFLGALASRHHLRFDLSKSGQHTLAPQTRQVLKNLPEPVEALAFFQAVEMGREPTEQLLSQFHYRNPKFTYRLVDPDQEPTLAERYQVNAYGTVVLVAGDRHESIKAVDEQNLTNALIRVTKKGQKIIYWLIGHGERSLTDEGKAGYSRLAASLKQQHYLIKPLVLATAKQVPADGAAVVVAGPRKPLAKVEKERLGAYLASGGRVLILLDPQYDGGLTEWLAARGVKLGQDLVVDLASREYGKSPFAPVSAAYADHEITRPMANTLTFFTVARSVSPAKKVPAGFQVVPLVFSSKLSWAETDLEGMRNKSPEFDKGRDTPGPVSLGVVVTLPAPKPKPGHKGPAPTAGQLVVIGDSEFAANPDLGQVGNRDLILNCISYLAQEADLVSLRPKMAGGESMILDLFQARMVFWLPVVVVPLIFAIIGVVVVLRRRRVA